MSALEQAVVWEGPDELRPFLVPIDELVDLDGNQREHNIPMLVESFRTYGQLFPIVVRDDGRSLVAGHGRKKACLELGWTHMAAIPSSLDSEQAAQLFSLVDNISHDAGRTLFEHVQESIFDQAMAMGMVEFEEFTRAKADAILTAEAVGGEHEYAETESEAATRARELAQSQRMKEAVMTMTLDEYELLGTRVRFLMAEYNTRGLGDTVMTALANEVERIEQERAS